MANFNRVGIGGIPVGDSRRDQRKPKYGVSTSELTNIANGAKVLNNSTALNTDRHLNTDFAFNEPKPIVFKTSDDILEILRSHPDIQRLPTSVMDAILASIVSVAGAGVGFALTIHLGGIGALAGAKLTISALVKFTGATALVSGGSAGTTLLILSNHNETFFNRFCQRSQQRDARQVHVD